MASCLSEMARMPRRHVLMRTSRQVNFYPPSVSREDGIVAERIAEVVILAEDQRSATFVRRYVKHAVSYRGIRVEIAPSGRQRL